MKNNLNIKMYSFTIDCLNPYELASFYAKLMNWEIAFYNDDWACLGAPGVNQGGYPGLTFQKNLDYKPPVWPTEKGNLQQMAHLDFAVDHLDEAVLYAIECGATVSKQQFSEDWKVMLDPSGHPFCLCQLKEIMNSKTFALL